MKKPMTEKRALELIVGKARNTRMTNGEAAEAVEIVKRLLDFNDRVRADLAVRFPWLLDGDTSANGSDTVDAVREWFDELAVEANVGYEPTNYFNAKGVVVDRI